jgi:hypothetical protein
MEADADFVAQTFTINNLTRSQHMLLHYAIKQAGWLSSGLSSTFLPPSTDTTAPGGLGPSRGGRGTSRRTTRARRGGRGSTRGSSLAARGGGELSTSGLSVTRGSSVPRKRKSRGDHQKR